MSAAVELGGGRILRYVRWVIEPSSIIPASRAKAVRKAKGLMAQMRRRFLRKRDSRRGQGKCVLSASKRKPARKTLDATNVNLFADQGRQHLG